MFYGLKAKEIIIKSQIEEFLKENTDQISSIKEAMEEIGINLSTAEIGKLFMDADAADMDINEYIRSRLGLNPEQREGDEKDIEDASETEQKQPQGLRA